MPEDEPEETLEVEPEAENEGNKTYLKDSGFSKLYPFAAVSFFDRETHDGLH